jgi:hypothetical protein
MDGSITGAHAQVMADSSLFQSAIGGFFRLPKVGQNAQHSLIEAGQMLNKLRRFQRADNATFSLCDDEALTAELHTQRRQEIATLDPYGFTPWTAICVTYFRDSANLADRERRDLHAMGEHVSITGDNRIRVHGLLMRHKDTRVIASISSLAIKFWSLTKYDTLLINSVITASGRARWARRLAGIGLSQHDIDASLPLSDISDPRIKLFRRESTKPVATAWSEHNESLASYELRGNPSRQLTTFSQYVTLAKRERACG